MEILNLKMKYPFTCRCGEELLVTPPRSMILMQVNSGMITCPVCKQFSGVSIDENNAKMVRINEPTLKGFPPACYRKATQAEVIRVMAQNKKR